MHSLGVRVAAFLIMGSVFSLSGCGGGDAKPRPETAPVSGTVKFNGAPVAGALVSFAAEASPRVAVGETNDKGEFSLTTFDTNDGAIIGDHTVTISKKSSASETENMDMESYAEMMAKSKDKDMRNLPGMDSKDLLPAKYADPAESGLTRTVVAGEENVFNFELE